MHRLWDNQYLKYLKYQSNKVFQNNFERDLKCQREEEMNNVFYEIFINL